MRMTLLGLTVLSIAAMGGTRDVAAAEIKVLTAGAFKQVLLALVPEFEKQTGHKVIVENETVGALTKRIEGGETFDVAVLTPGAVNDLTGKGKFVAGSRANLARVGVGVMVKAGAPAPDISTVEAFKRALLDAPSIAYSASASGVYYETVLLKKLGIEEQVKPKSKRILSERVATVVARGEAVMGLQQVSELLPIEGADFVGPIPKELQQVTVFAAGISSTAKQPEAAKQLVRYFTSPAAAPTIRNGGLEPAPQP
jgi:molybdate transport system substrate-binding protein